MRRNAICGETRFVTSECGETRFDTSECGETRFVTSDLPPGELYILKKEKNVGGVLHIQVDTSSSPYRGTLQGVMQEECYYGTNCRPVRRHVAYNSPQHGRHPARIRWRPAPPRPLLLSPCLPPSLSSCPPSQPHFDHSFSPCVPRHPSRRLLQTTSFSSLVFTIWP